MMNGSIEKDFVRAARNITQYLLTANKDRSDIDHCIIKRLAESRPLQIIFEPAFRNLVSEGKIIDVDFLEFEDRNLLETMANTYLPNEMAPKRLSFIRCLLAFNFLISEKIIY